MFDYFEIKDFFDRIEINIWIGVAHVEKGFMTKDFFIEKKVKPMQLELSNLLLKDKSKWTENQLEVLQSACLRFNYLMKQGKIEECSVEDYRPLPNRIF